MARPYPDRGSGHAKTRVGVSHFIQIDIIPTINFPRFSSNLSVLQQLPPLIVCRCHWQCTAAGHCVLSDCDPKHNGCLSDKGE